MQVQRGWRAQRPTDWNVAFWVHLRRKGSDNSQRARSYELTRIWRNQIEEEPRSSCTLSTAADSILDMACGVEAC